MSLTANTLSSVVGGGYVGIDENGCFVKPEGHLDDESLELEKVSVGLDPSRDISQSMGTNNCVRIRGARLIYPDGDVSTSLVCTGVLENRATIGIVKEYGRSNSRRWQGGYMRSFATIGIPTDVYEWLKRAVDKAIGVPSQTPDWSKSNKVKDGFNWLTVKVPDSTSRADALEDFMSIVRQGACIVVKDPIKVMQSLKANLYGVLSMSFRLKRTADHETRLPARWDLGITVHHIQIIRTTPFSSPPISDRVLAASTSDEAADDVAEIVSNLSLESETGAFPSDSTSSNQAALDTLLDIRK